MNGSVFLLIIAMLLQNPGNEVLPGPTRNGSVGVAPAVLPAAPSFSQSDPAGAMCKVGWGTDVVDGKFCMIIQIAPEAIAAFAKGPQGQELPADVPDSIRNRIQKVIVRFGSGEVERNPPNPTLSDNVPNRNPAFVDYLDNRTVAIDAPRSPNVMPTSGGATLQNGNGLGNPNFSSNNGTNSSLNSDRGVYPNSPSTPTGYSDGSRPYATLGDGMNGGLTGLPGLGSNYSPNASGPPTNNRSDAFPNNYSATNSSVARDGFQPAPTRSPSLEFLQPNRTTGGTSGYATNPYPATPGSYPSTTNNNNRTYIPLANNTNPTHNSANNGYYDSSNPNLQPPGFLNNSPSPSLSQMQHYGAPIQQQNPYSTGGTNLYSPPPITSPSFAGIPNPGARLTMNSQPNLNEVQLLEEQPVLARDKVLPFLLLFSIVCNVYLGFWMSHQRTRYRQLLSNVRGIPVADLD